MLRAFASHQGHPDIGGIRKRSQISILFEGSTQNATKRTENVTKVVAFVCHGAELCIRIWFWLNHNK
jgi:hypothetical protein